MYGEVWKYVKDYLSAHDGEAVSIGHFPFRKRSEHIKRVFMWAERLMDDPQISGIDQDAVLTAALFHDVGYSPSLGDMSHAENGALIFGRYADEHGYDRGRSEFISYLIRNHSRKDIMFHEDTPLELIIVMEADLLDETGALSVVWDCMTEGAQAEQSFHRTYNHIVRYSGKMLDSNPMFTEKAKKIWREKQELVAGFIKRLACDLGEEQWRGKQ